MESLVKKRSVKECLNVRSKARFPLVQCTDLALVISIVEGICRWRFRMESPYIIEWNFSVYKSLQQLVLSSEMPKCLWDNHGRTGRKKIGGRKEICPTFSDWARVVKKIFRRNFPKLLSTVGGEE